jgi:hypothetical protein
MNAFRAAKSNEIEQKRNIPDSSEIMMPTLWFLFKSQLLPRHEKCSNLLHRFDNSLQFGRGKPYLFLS